VRERVYALELPGGEKGLARLDRGATRGASARRTAFYGRPGAARLDVFLYYVLVRAGRAVPGNGARSLVRAEEDLGADPNPAHVRSQLQPPIISFLPLPGGEPESAFRGRTRFRFPEEGGNLGGKEPGLRR